MLRINDEAPNFTAETSQGTINFHEWIGNGWAVLFSHPKDFTPVCTTELGYMAGLQPDFEKRNCKIIGLSVDPVSSHSKWMVDIEETQGHKVKYPMIGDPELKVAKLYDMLPADAGNTSEGRTAAANATVRTVFVIGPDKKIKLMLSYPMSTGRNFDEVLRVLDSIQLTAKQKVATPVNWKQGDDVIILPSVPEEEAKQKYPGVQSAKLNLYGRITTLSGRVVQTFEDVVSRDFPDSLFQSSVNLSSIYQKSVPLRSGLYRLDVVLKDAQSGNVGVIDAALRVPLYEEESLDASSLILADQIHPVPTSQIGQGPFVLGNYKVRPRINPQFSPADKMGIFLQLYNLKLGAQSHKTSISVAYRILKDHQQVWQQDESSEQLQQSREQITLERKLPLSSLSPGRYSLEIYVIDLLTNQTVTRSADFTVKLHRQADHIT